MSMSQTVLFSVIESPVHPNFSNLYQGLGIQEVRLSSIRKALAQLKKQQPDYIVAEFFYGYGNNYAGVNISNLDVLLSSLQKYAPAARVIVLVDKAEHPDAVLEVDVTHRPGPLRRPPPRLPDPAPGRKRRRTPGAR